MGAQGFGNVMGFSKVPVDWRCPVCCRSKAEMARLDKNCNLLCAIPSHHDHFADEAYDRLKSAGDENWQMRTAFAESFSRFPPTLVCNDCNIADVQAKSSVGAPSYFSFAPHEIACFIEVKPNQPHQLKPAAAQEMYESLKPTMRILARRLIQLKEDLSGEGAGR